MRTHLAIIRWVRRSLSVTTELLRGRLGSNSDDLRTSASNRRRGIEISVCIVIATILWLLLSLDEPEQARFNLETTVVNMPMGQGFVDTPPRNVMADVSGDVLTLMRLKFRQPILEIDASQEAMDLEDGVIWPPGVTAVDIGLPPIILTKEPRAFRTVPVRSRVQIRPAARYFLFDEPTLTPDSVTIEGAESIIGKINFWPTEVIPELGVKDTVSMVVELADSLSGLVSLSADRVTLEAETHYFTEGERVIRVSVTGIPNAMEVVDLDPHEVTIRYYVPLEDFHSVSESSDFLATVPYEAIRQDTTGMVMPLVSLPEDMIIHHVQTKPNLIQYFVKIGEN